jgi:hypothetical protein
MAHFSPASSAGGSLFEARGMVKMAGRELETLSIVLSGLVVFWMTHFPLSGAYQTSRTLLRHHYKVVGPIKAEPDVGYREHDTKNRKKKKRGLNFFLFGGFLDDALPIVWWQPNFADIVSAPLQDG